MLAGLLTACAPASPEQARAGQIARCERQFGKMAADAAKGTQLCTCLTDTLAAEGLEITDMFGGDRDRIEAAMRTCAARAGVKVPQ